ncbi:MAG: TonB family protein [Cyclobacteriaceae bacterium]|nr:TonB family protein [Cyclobacteriaceae bacterium]
MFTSNFFSDNSQLNFGKHFSHKILLNKGEKKLFRKLIESITLAKKSNNKLEKARVFLFRSLGFLIAMIVVVLAFEWKTYDSVNRISLNVIETNTDEFLDIPITVQPPPPPPKKMAVSIIEIPKYEEIEEEVEIDFDIETNEEMVIQEVNYDEIDKVNEEEADDIFLIVESSPQPVGGLSAFYEFVANEINYPKAALRAQMGGKVFVMFVVNKDGSLSDFEIVKGVGLGCDEEAIRVLKKAPNWISGKQRGKNVRVRMVLPINFVLKNR